MGRRLVGGVLYPGAAPFLFEVAGWLELDRCGVALDLLSGGVTGEARPSCRKWQASDDWA